MGQRRMLLLGDDGNVSFAQYGTQTRLQGTEHPRVTEVKLCAVVWNRKGGGRRRRVDRWMYAWAGGQSFCAARRGRSGGEVKVMGVLHIVFADRGNGDVT